MMSVPLQTFLLNKRVHYNQPRELYRTGIEPVILAAAIPAKAGDRVLELGTGAGAGLLCLATRVEGVRGVGVEIQPELVQLAEQNLAINGLTDHFLIIQGDLLINCPAGPFDHGFCNPPWHLEQGTASPKVGRDLARRTKTNLLKNWVMVMARRLVHRGTLTLIIPAGALPTAFLALSEGRFGAISLLPLWPKVGRQAKIALLHAIHGAAGPCRVLPGLVLHEADGRFTPEADAILRDGNGLSFDC